MSRVEPESLAHHDPTPVFIAATLAEAKRAESLLTERGVQFFVTVESFGRTLFGSPRHGALFSVSATQASYCAVLLTEAGLGLGVLHDPSS